jgi:hypothetical protein
MKYSIKHISIIFALVISFSLSFKSFGQSQKIQSDSTSDSITVVQTLDHFIDAFVSLNWEKFVECFADDATAFFPPSAKFPSRANSKIEIENIFKNVFENARKQRSSPPYIVIEPKDLKIQMLGDVSIVTFVLNDPDLFGRRTIIFEKLNGKWLIVHLHASGVIIPK